SLQVLDLKTMKPTSDTVRWLKGGSVSWTKDGKGFFYARFPEPESGKQLQNAIGNEKIYYHKLGTAQSADKEIYARPDHPDWFVSGGVTDNGRYLFVYVNRGTETANRLYVADLGDAMHPKVNAPIKPLFDKGDADYSPIEVVGTTVYMETDLNAPKRRIVSFDIGKPDPSNWKTIV